MQDKFLTTTPPAAGRATVRSLTILLIVSVGAAVAGDYDIDWYTVDGGGTSVSTGGSYSLAGTVGQPDAQQQARSGPSADLDSDGDVDGTDFLTFATCFNGSLNPPKSSCPNIDADLDADGDVDGTDFLTFATCYNGSLQPSRCTHYSLIGGFWGVGS